MYEPLPSELCARIVELVSEVTHTPFVADHDARTGDKRGPVTPAEMQEISSRINVLLHFGPAEERPLPQGHDLPHAAMEALRR